jgi:geranylgeranyl pyrophosphate synthase
MNVPVRLPAEDLPIAFSARVADTLRTRLGLAAPVEAPVVHLLDRPGKALRPELAFAVAEACGSDPAGKGVFSVAAAVELVHLASLIHDDLVDGATERRGATAVHRLYDPTMAVLAGDYMLGAAFALLAADACEATIRRLGPAVHALAEAELLEVRARGSAPDFALSRRIAVGKTGALFGWAAAGAALESRDWAGEFAWAEWGETIGLWFQLADDLGDTLAIADGKDLGLDAATETPTMLAALMAQAPDGRRVVGEMQAWAARIARPPARGPRLNALVDGIHERGHERLDLWQRSL